MLNHQPTQLFASHGLPTAGRAQPARSPDTEFFWQGLLEGHLLFQRCSDCALVRHPPSPTCPRCGALGWETVESSGRGRIHSFVVQHHPLPQGFSQPAVVVLVELDDPVNEADPAGGVRIVSNLAAADSARLVIGAEVELFLLAQDEGWVAPQFRLSPPSTE